MIQVDVPDEYIEVIGTANEISVLGTVTECLIEYIIEVDNLNRLLMSLKLLTRLV